MAAAGCREHGRPEFAGDGLAGGAPRRSPGSGAVHVDVAGGGAAAGVPSIDPSARSGSLGSATTSPPPLEGVTARVTLPRWGWRRAVRVPRQARSASPRSENRVTCRCTAPMVFDALGAAPLLADTPLLVVHGRPRLHSTPELAAGTCPATNRQVSDCGQGFGHAHPHAVAIDTPILGANAVKLGADCEDVDLRRFGVELDFVG